MAPKGSEKNKKSPNNLQIFPFWSHGQAVLHLNGPRSNAEKALLGSASSQVPHRGPPRSPNIEVCFFVLNFSSMWDSAAL